MAGRLGEDSGIGPATVARVRGFVVGLLPQSDLGRSITVLAGGTFAGQAIAFGASLALTRIYSPGDMGVLAVYAAILGVSSVVACLRYDVAVPLPKRESSAVSLFAMSMASLVVTTGILTMIIALGGQAIASALGTADSDGSYLWMQPLGHFTVGAYVLLSYWAIRVRDARRLATTRITQATGGAGTQIILGLLDFTPAGLIVGHIVGQSGGSLSLGRMVAPVIRRSRDALRPRNVWHIAKRYRRFPLVSTWDGLVNALSTQIPVLLIASLFGLQYAGLFALGYRVLQTPLAAIGSAISQAFYGHSAEADRTGSLSELTGRLFDRLMTVGLPLTLVAALAGAPVFAAVFGDEWREAGRYVQYLSVYMFFSFLANPLSTIVWVKEAQLGSLLFQFSLLASRVGGVLLGASMNSVRAAVVLLALAGAGVFLVYLTWILRLAGCPPRHLVSSVAGQLPRAALAVCPLLIVLFLPGLLGGDWGVTVGAAVSSVLAVALPVRRPQVSA